MQFRRCHFLRNTVHPLGGAQNSPAGLFMLAATLATETHREASPQHQTSLKPCQSPASALPKPCLSPAYLHSCAMLSGRLALRVEQENCLNAKNANITQRLDMLDFMSTCRNLQISVADTQERVRKTEAITSPSKAPLTGTQNSFKQDPI